jgi:hypothetical protein
MSKILDEVLAANAKSAENFGDKGSLPLPPSRHFAILTCMDARLDPAKYAGLAEGDAHVIRNAGGRASDDAKSVVEDVMRIRHHPPVPNHIPILRLHLPCEIRKTRRSSGCDDGW